MVPTDSSEPHRIHLRPFRAATGAARGLVLSILLCSAFPAVADHPKRVIDEGTWTGPTNDDAWRAAKDACKAESPTGSCHVAGPWPDSVFFWTESFFDATEHSHRVLHEYRFTFTGCDLGLGAPGSGRCLDELVSQVNTGQPLCSAGEGASMQAGNPIHVGTGNKYQRETDIAATAAGGLGFVRHYNSRSPEPGLGLGQWRHQYARRLVLDLDYDARTEELDPDLTQRAIQLVRPDGRRILFYRTAEHTLAASAADIPDWLPAVGTDQYPLHWTGSEWRYRNGSGALEFFDSEGRLLRIVDREGYTQFVEHDTAGRVTAVSDDFGRTLGLEYDGQGRLVRLIDQGGDTYAYGYDGVGNLASVTSPDGSTRRYHYGEFGAPVDYLTGITDATGARFASWQYDEEGRAILSEHAGGVERTEITYLDGGGAQVTDASGNVRTYTIESVRSRMLPASIENGCAACGDATDWEYNDLGLATRVTDRNGNVTTYQYDEHGLESARTEAAGTAVARGITTEWDTDLRLPLAVHELGRRTEYTYDGRGRRLSMSEIDTATGDRRTTTWTYHPHENGVPGQLAAINGPRTDVADVTTFDYDAQGNRTRVTNALGHVTAITDHDPWGRPLRIEDPNELVTTLAYDARGRLLSREVGGELTTFGYDAAGNLTSVELPDGSALNYSYDAAQRLVALADEDGNRVEYTLDAAGNRIRQDVRDASRVLVRTQQQLFDEFDRLIETVGAQGQRTTYSYDKNGNRIGTTDPVGDDTHHAFDALDRLTTVTDPEGGITDYTYDTHDRVTSVIDPNGNTTTYTYDGLGNRIRRDSPDSGITTWEYDDAGNVIAKTDARGQRTEYAYDSLNRLIATQYADGATVAYAWDEGTNGIGRLARIDEIRADGWASTIGWTYDAHGRVLEHRQVADGVTLVTQHTYDAAGRPSETVYPSGRVVTYSHEADALTGITVDGEIILENANYEPFGPVSGWTWGDDDVHERRYDLDGRLVEHGLAVGSEGGGTRTIDYHRDDNIAAIHGPNLDRTYGYDGLDRLVSATDPDLTDRYTYDLNGNRLRRRKNGETETYTIEPGSNRLLGISGARNVSYTYDANGSLVDDGDHTYTYGARNRLVAVDGGDTAVYRYNALGQRIFKRTGSDVDYAALAEEYRQKADDLAAEAAALRAQAQQKRAEADAAANEAQALLEEAEMFRIEADQHEQQAATLKEEATRLRSEAEALHEQADRKEAEAQPLQEQADRLLADARRLRTEAEAERDAAKQDQQRADALAATASERLERAAALERQATENDSTAAAHRARAPELEAEADSLRVQANDREAEAQPYLEAVERLERRIAPLQRSVERFSARIEHLREQLIANPHGWRDYWRNIRLRFRIRVWEWVGGWLQWRLDAWLEEQAAYQQQADALLAEAADLRAEADRKDALAIELAKEADRLESEAVELRAEAEQERALAGQEQDDSAEFARKAEAHRGTARDLDNQAQAKEAEAQPLAERARTLRADAESLRTEAGTKAATAAAKEQEADDLAQRATDKLSDAAGKEQQAETLNEEAGRLYDDAGVLQGRADEKHAEADTARQQADEYAERADNPTVANEGQFFVYDQNGRLIGRYDESGEAIREYFLMGNLPAAVKVNDQLHYIHSDHLGTPRQVSKPNGSIVWLWISNPFGDTAPKEDPDGDDQTFTLNVRFLGQYRDSETGFYYNYFRTYDTRIGRYMSSDPIGLHGGKNTYAYALNSPSVYSDKFGLVVTKVCRSMGITFGLTHHCSIFVWHWVHDKCGNRGKVIDAQFSLSAPNNKFDNPADPSNTYRDDRHTFRFPDEEDWVVNVPVPGAQTQKEFDENVMRAGEQYRQRDYCWGCTPNSNTAADTIIYQAGGQAPLNPEINAPGSNMDPIPSPP